MGSGHSRATPPHASPFSSQSCSGRQGALTVGFCMCWEGVPASSVPELQPAGTTQWSILKPEQPLAPNNSKSSPSRPFRLSHITQPQNKVRAFAGTSSDWAGTSKQAAAQPKSSVEMQRQRVPSQQHAPRSKKTQAATTTRKPRAFTGPGPACTGAASRCHWAVGMLGFLLAQCWLLATQFPTRQ